MEYMQIAKRKAKLNFQLSLRYFALAGSLVRPACTDVLGSYIRSSQRFFNKIFARISSTVGFWPKSRWRASLSTTKFAAVQPAAV